MYRTKQIGWVIIILLMLVMIGQLILVMILEDNDQEVKPYIYLTIAVFGALLLLFYRLETVIDQTEIRISFGIGLIKKKIALGEIEQTEAVRNTFWYGWGIRLTPHGWMWNIAGYDAVQLTLKSGKKFRIGTDNAQLLKSEIDKRL
jgi:lipid-A-disaccharide synthase-like uncharacterized protein